jgi:hypothetical protein
MNDSETTAKTPQTSHTENYEHNYFVPQPLCMNRLKDYYQWLKEEKEAREEYQKQYKIDSICHKE